MSTQETLPKIPDTPKPGLYRHYKNLNYEVLSVARHSETLEYFVVYKQLYGDRGTWIRPREMFLESVVIDGQQAPRFTYVGPA